jgi:hypothetical protein
VEDIRKKESEMSKEEIKGSKKGRGGMKAPIMDVDTEFKLPFGFGHDYIIK